MLGVDVVLTAMTVLAMAVLMAAQVLVNVEMLAVAAVLAAAVTSLLGQVPAPTFQVEAALLMVARDVRLVLVGSSSRE